MSKFTIIEVYVPIGEENVSETGLRAISFSVAHIQLNFSVRSGGAFGYSHANRDLWVKVKVIHFNEIRPARI